MAKELRILLIEDVPADAELEVRELKRAGLHVAHRVVDTEDAYRDALRDFRPDLILSDFSMPHFDGMLALALARELVPDVPFIFVSGTIGEEYAIRALKNGATDYVLKNNLVRLPSAVERALQDTMERAARRRVEEALRESQEKYRLLWETTSDAVILMDEATRIQYANPAVMKVLGYAPEEVTGREIAMLQPERLREAHRRGVKRYLDTGVKTLNWGSTEVVALHRDGHEFPVEISFSHMDFGGKPLFAGFMRDITARKEAEKHRARLSAILEASPDFVATADPNRKVLYLNSAARRLLELPEDVEALQVRIGDTHPPWAAELVLKTGIPTAIRDGVWSGETAFLTRGGREVPVIQVILAHKGADGSVEFLSTIARDISERKNQELKITRLSRIHSVLSGINSAIVRIRDRQELFNEACRIAVEHGGFGMAWIGAYDPAAQEVTPVAWAGLEAGEYLGGVKSIIRDDLPQGRGVLAQAIRSRKPVINNDITLDPAVGGKRRAEAIRRGYRAVVVLPLIVEGEVTGTLSLFAKELNFFDDEELKLLTELAGDVSFALEHIAGQEKIEKLSRVRAVSSGINAAIVRFQEQDTLLRETCRITIELGKFRMIWIGMLDRTTMNVQPVAWAGIDDTFMRELRVSIRDDGPGGQGTTPRAVRSKQAAWDNDFAANPELGYIRRYAIERGVQSAISLPLVIEGEIEGVFSLYAEEAGFFTEDEIRMLEELASNVSLALERMVHQEKLEKLSRIRAVLGEMNAAIVRIRDKQQLFEEACRIAHEHGKFTLSWIGMLDEAAQAVRPVAKAGREEGYLERLNLSIDPNITRNLALAVEAVGRSAPVICNDIATDGRMRAWRTAALERGYRSMVMLPLLLEQRAVGVFALYSPEPGFFDEEEMKLLVELAGDIAFALQTIEKQEKLDYLSYYDPLTGLPNRTLFHDRVNQALQAQRESGGKAALLFLDLQRFGIVNDTYGRQTGDALLKLVAGRLESVLGSRDYLARIGADTFATVLRDVKQEADVAHTLEQGILNSLKQPFETGGVEIRMAAQAGIALFPGDGNDADTLFRNAEAALNKAKDAGDVYLFYAPQMNARVAEQLKLENELRNAIVNEQYVLHYQPRFDLASGQIVGMEALIRWKHPERGLVPPGEFIPLLEETGMILDVGRWALRRAALQHAAWCAKGRLPPRIAVNVSPAQLRRRDFVDQVKDALAPVERAAERLDIEITESMLMEDIEGSIDKLKAVQSLGLQVALDDFGTGYSSLSYLARLPINSLKIDRSFIMQMSKGPEQMAIVSTVISLARALNLKVVAEGVETEEQANLLRLLRCDEAQGYLFGRPVPPEELQGKLRQA